MGNIRKKPSIIFALLITMSFFLPFILKGDSLLATTPKEAIVNATSLNVRSGPGTNYSIIGSLFSGEKVLVISEVIPSETSGTPNGWYQITYNNGNSSGYVYIDFITIINSGSTDPNADFEQKLQNEGFPITYWPYLKALHSQYPNWQFKAIKTNLDFTTAVREQDYFGKALISGSQDQGYRSFGSQSYDYNKDIFYQVPNEPNWYQASNKTIAYYHDPRNFLNERNIFMFEDLTFNSSFQTEAVVNRIFTNTFMPSLYPNYASSFMKAANDYNVSPVHLSSRIIQEVGVNGSIASSGASFVYNGLTYSGLYNFYNIGAYGYTPPAIKGLIWANGGENNGTTKLTTYLRPWTSPEKSILGGAYYLSDGYINKGQYTPYFQKWNVSPTSAYPKYTHQYMTNIMAPVSEASKSFTAYSTQSLLNEAMVFSIPVYNNMPDATSMPNRGNPNNYLNNIKVNNVILPSFSNDKLDYEYYVSSATGSINISVETINSKATITGAGTIQLPNQEQQATIVVKAENGDVREYRIKIIKNDASPISVSDILNGIGVKFNNTYISGIKLNTNTDTLSTNIKNINPSAEVLIRDINNNIKSNKILATNDSISITSNGENKIYKFIIYGDTNGDGVIDIIDLLRVQKLVLKTMTASEPFLIAADTNKDGNVDIIDLLRVQKHILGSIVIEQ
jgi:beta-N-acetylglucosaminidase